MRRLDVLWLSPALVVLAVGVLTLNPVPVGVLPDDAIYVILAKSLATGQGYSYLNLLNIPMSAGAMLRPIVLTVRSGVDSSETVAVSAEAAAYLYSGPASVPIYSYEIDHFFRPPTIDEEARAIDAIAAAYDVDVVLASTGLQRQAVRALQRPGRASFKLRDSTAGGLIFVRKGS